MRQDGTKLDDVKLPPWAKSAEDLFAFKGKHWNPSTFLKLESLDRPNLRLQTDRRRSFRGKQCIPSLDLRGCSRCGCNSGPNPEKSCGSTDCKFRSNAITNIYQATPVREPLNSPRMLWMGFISASKVYNRDSFSYIDP